MIQNILNTIVSFFVMAFGFKIWFGDWILVWILMFSIALHEIGHILSLLLFGLRTRLLFIPFMGAATIPLDADAFSNLKWFKRGITFLSGPMANLLIIATAAFYYYWSQDPDIERYALITIGLNAALGVWNLIPLGGMDGDGYASAIFESLPGYKEKYFVAAIRISITAVSVILIVRSSGIPFLFLLLAYTIGQAATKDDERNAYTARAMSVKQAIILTATYIMLFSLMLIAEAFSPNWVALSGIATWPFFLMLGLILIYTFFVRSRRRISRT